ncbi:CGNR zinc finger domain-containing protein [Raineyella sp. LH-20]|uniref:CGNR zinc finger domain-containing protein n=1 Tax=Raineyella sp. LH-20 TaxID=3081204 RepID=UPI002955A51F|nr:CGNR zinc finger domain-containing protein [Raineyella sp. LH-20]WOP19345.1 CGNR zinc finger domain-containing protein [Raineyella sp. LH-20]
MATERLQLSAAPGPLAFVQDLLNTAPIGTRSDLLEATASAEGWLRDALEEWAEQRAVDAPTVELSDSGVHRLRDLRDDLRGVLYARDTSDAPGPVDVTARWSEPAVVDVDGGGVASLLPVGRDWHVVASLVAIEILEAQRSGAWPRLKVCRNTTCAASFFDRSRNNSGVWHSTRTCGNVANLRAHRSRRRAAGTAQEPDRAPAANA